MDTDKEIEYRKILSILEQSVVVDENFNSDSLGKDLHEITKELTDDKNSFRFTHQSRISLPYDSLLLAIGEVPTFPDAKKVKPRYSFVNSYMKCKAILQGAVNSESANRYSETASAIMAFRGMLEYRERGIRNEDGSKKSIVDRLKKE